MDPRIPTSTIRRLSGYYRVLEELETEGHRTISSQGLAHQSGVTSAQVRKDLSYFGNFGKRGLGYNATGARNWEWFELAESPDRVLIVWRGVGPPTNDSYGGDPNGGCNACHARCGAPTDFICSPSLGDRIHPSN